MHSLLLTLEYTSVYYPLENASIFHQSSKSKQASLWREGIHGLVLIDNLFPLQQTASRLTVQPSQLSVTLRQQDPNFISVLIRGSSQELVNFARLEVLQSYTQITFRTLELTLGNIQTLIDSATGNTSNIVASFFTRLDDLSCTYNIEYIITFDGKISIFGAHDNVTITETKMRILINTLLEDYFVDTFDIALSTLPLIGGANLINFNQIARQLSSNIYVPDLLPELLNSKILNLTENLPIYIASKQIPGILLSQKLLTQLYQNTIKSDGNTSKFIIKEIEVSRGKLDLLTILDQLEILSIMFKYSVFIELPSLGSGVQYSIKVQGYDLTMVMDAIDDLNLIISKYYLVSIEIPSHIAPETLLLLLRTRKSCIITCNDQGMELLGQREDICNVLVLLNRCITNPVSVSVAIELNNSQKEFISGKKNGKFLKVLNQLEGVGLNSIVEFEAYNEYNFMMNFHIKAANSVAVSAPAGSVISLTLKGIDLLFLELPAEVKFNVPDVFHKSIIGNGGSIIQSIMKKYNVFIKFSSCVPPSDLPPSLIYTLARTNNVLIKCPNKNAKSIALVKYEIDNLVYKCCNDNLVATYPNSTVYLTTHFKILKSQYISLINNHGSNVNSKILSIESQTNTFIDFPKAIENFDLSEELTFKIKGSDVKSKQAALKISEILPKCFRMKISYLPGKFEDTFLNNNEEYLNKIVYPFKLLLGGVELSVYIEGSNALEQPSYHLILIHHWGNEIVLNRAVDELKGFLRLKNLNILDKEIYNYDGIVDTPSVPLPNSSPAKKLRTITNVTTPSRETQSKYHNQQKKNRRNNKKPLRRQNVVV